MQVKGSCATVTRQALAAHLLAWEKSIRAAPNRLPFLLPDDQGMGPGWSPALGSWPRGKVWDNTATWWLLRCIMAGKVPWVPSAPTGFFTPGWAPWGQARAP